MSSIGIKIANGEFYPILDDEVQAKKRLVLTTVRDGQKSVQIDLYRSATQTMTDAQPIGSLVVEEIKARKKGEPSVELIIGVDNDGEISAEAKDLDNPDSSENNQLTVSLRTLTEQGEDENIPEFDLDNFNPDISVGALPETESSFAESSFAERPFTESPFIDKEPSEKRRVKSSSFKSSSYRRKKSALPFILAIASAIIVGFFVYFLLGANKNTTKETIIYVPIITPAQGAPQNAAPSTPQNVPPPPPPPPPTLESTPNGTPQGAPAVPSAVPVPAVPPAPPPVEQAAPEPLKVEPVAPPPVVKAPKPKATKKKTRARPNPPVRSFKVPAVIPKGGIAYRLRYGDTLWDIARAFYRNPRNYTYLARYNGIKNPNRVVAGQQIRIPPIPR